MATVFCDASATGSNNGNNWEDAYTSLSTAITNASASDEVWVKEGTFTSTPYTLKANVSIYGGFDSALTGTSGSVAGRDLDNDITSIDAASSGRCLTIVSDGHLDGFTVKNGNVTGTGGAFSVFNRNNVTIDNCIFDSNTASSHGGGIYITTSTGWSMSNCTISNNTAGGVGGGLYLDCTIDMTDCVVDTNTSSGGSWDANGIYVGTGVVGTFERIEVKNGVYSGTEPQVFYRATGVVDFKDFSIHSSDGQGFMSVIGGSLTWDGGEVYNNVVRGVNLGTAETIKNIKIYDNGSNVYGQGAGIRFVGAVSATVENCVITGNETGNTGAGVAVMTSGGSPTINNCVIADNVCPSLAGGIYTASGASATVTNCIVWNNSGTEITAGNTVTYSDVDGGYTGTGNINSNPSFVGSGDDSYNISSGSPCIDAGDGDSAPTLDILGNARVDDPNTSNTGTGTPVYTDIGAYEYQPVVVTDNAIFFGCNF